MSQLNLQHIEISISSLYLDSKNPRFHSLEKVGLISELPPFDPRNQELIRRYLIHSESANSLINSITTLGFVNMDSIVVKKIESTDKYIIVEGNRRVAALKTMLNDIERRAITLPSNIIKTLDPIEVKLLDNSCDSIEVMLLQGVRHLAGAKSWGPYQQGHLLHSIVYHKGLSVKEAATAIGLSYSRATIVLKAYYGLRQMYEDEIYGRHANPSYFSHFEQAYIKLPVREWLGWDETTKRYQNTKNFNFFCNKIIPELSGTTTITAKDIRDYLPSILLNELACIGFIQGMSITEANSLLANEDDDMNKLFENIKPLLQVIPNVSHSTLDKKSRDSLLKLHAITSELIRNF